MKRQTLFEQSPGAKHGSLTRRQVLAAGAAAAVFSIVPRHVLGGPGYQAPSERITLAGVGIGGVGNNQLQGCDQAGFQIVALCDVDDVYAKRSYDRWPQARRYRDFRELLSAEGDRIDALYCGTPDHTHAIITLAALAAGKHVCCVKPLTRTIAESRVVVAAAKKAGTATQVTASPNTDEEGCRTCELIAAGAIGPVREVHVWSNRPLWPQGMTRPAGNDPVPATLDWDLWIGPAPMRPFKDQWPEGYLALEQLHTKNPRNAVYHPWNFRGWWDFGTGALGDMGCHHLNTPYRALKLEYPEQVQASASVVNDETAPLASIVTYDYPAREGMPAVRVIWYDGGLCPPSPAGMPSDTLPREGTLYVGDEGLMLSSKILDSDRARKFADVPRTLERRGGTWVEWLEACQGGQPAGCPFDWAGLLTEFTLLGNIALRTGKPIAYDHATMSIPGNAEANRLITPTYENGWTLPSSA